MFLVKHLRLDYGQFLMLTFHSEVQIPIPSNNCVFLLFLPLHNLEIMRVSSMAHDHGFSDFDRRRYRSPSPMSSPIMRPNLHGNGFGPWNGIHQEVGT